MPTPHRKPTNLTIDAGLLAEARALDVNLSRAAEAGVAQAVAAERRKLWLAENAQAIESSNAHVAAHGLPLGALRRF